MKNLVFSLLALAAVTVPASAITVTTPVSRAQLTSPFQLTASTATCDSKPAVSMGYSIDNGPTTIVSTSFNAMVSAPVGAHVLHVKCWGQLVADAVAVNITILPPSAASTIAVKTPGNGAQVISPFSLVASANTCDSVPAVSMGYSIDDAQAIIVPTSFSAIVTAAEGAHVLHVKCWGRQTSSELLLNIKVVPVMVPPPPVASAIPLFSPTPGTYTSVQSVTLSAATPGSTIYYTTDGSAPTASSPQYTGAIEVGASRLIQAIAVAPDYAVSDLAKADYVITQLPAGPSIPANAITETQLQLLPNWKFNHDPGTIGSSTGAITLVSAPSLSGEAARYGSSFTDWGGEIYSVSYATDPNAKNFLYDTKVWIAAGSQVGNLEMDNNQVIANGNTVIYAFQCDGDSNAWDYSENAGTPKEPVIRWVHSSAPCNPAEWAPNAWHHVQISYSRDDIGNVTYNSVWLDGVEAPINRTVLSAFTLGWAHGTLLTNFQVDGVGAGGSSALYVDNLTIYRW